MDAIDSKILACLLEDSRQSLNAVGRRVRLSRENVHYRIERLKERGIIKSFVTTIDHRRLGMRHFGLALALHRASPQQETEIIALLAKHPNFTWLGPAAGSWNILIDAYAKDREALETIFQPFYDKHKQFISRYRILEIASMTTWFHKHIAAIPTKKTKTGSYIPDATDKKLLAAIANDSRATYVELGKITKLTANACRYRLRNLEKSGIIQGYTLNIEPTAMGYQWYTVQLTTAETDSAAMRAFYRYCESHPDILFYYNYFRSGEQDFDVGYLVKTHDDLRTGLNDLKQRFPGIMVENLFLPYVQVTSHSLPSAVFK